MTSIGALEPGETAEHEPFEYALRQLNRMVKAWQAVGYNLWRATEGEITLVTTKGFYDDSSGTDSPYLLGGTGSPDFSVRPLRIESMSFVQSDGTSSPRMIQMARKDYFNLPTKKASGTSTQFYYDPQRTNGKLYIWPILSAVSGEKIRFTYQRSFDDFDAATNEPDIPQEWFKLSLMVSARY